MLLDLTFFFKNLFLDQVYIFEKKILRSLKKPLEPEIKILNSLVNKSKSCIDIGAFRGVYSYRLSELSKRVYCFEPNPIMFGLLNNNLNKLKKNVEIYNVALSDTAGYTNLKIPLQNKSFFKKNFEYYYEAGKATIEEKNKLENKKFDTFKVETRKLDDYDFKDEIGFIKLDAEGHELKVLLGAQNTINLNKPVLFVEINSIHCPNVDEVFKLIKKMGYNMYYYDDFNLINVKNYSDNPRSDFRHFICKFD